MVQWCTTVTAGRLAMEGLLCNFGAAAGASPQGSGSSGEASSLLVAFLGVGGSLECFLGLGLALFCWHLASVWVFGS